MQYSPGTHMSFQYLARLGTSGLVLSITTCFSCLSAAWHVLTQRCHEPSVSCGTHQQVTSQSGELPSLKRRQGVEGAAPLTLFTWTYPADTRCFWMKVDLPAVGAVQPSASA